MANILVTGANGQLGSEINAIKEEYPGFNFLFTDIQELDLTKKSEVEQYISSNSVDVCLNCAAYTAVDKAEDDRDLAMLVNADAVKILSQACNKYEVRLIHISTDYVFDGTNHKPYVETDSTEPNSFYGITKLEGEKVLKENIDNYVIIRTSWLYSNYGNNFVKTMMRLGNERDELGVVVDQVGTPTFAADLAKAIMVCAVGTKTGTYHYSNQGVISWYDFAKTIMQINKIDCKINPIESKDFPAKAPRPFYSVLNKSKIINDFGIDIPYWLDSLKLMIERIK
ncbi:MAG: dTDP-4-dehydrorhamnose reductase [Marinilabiliales bacterium]|nr:MAG: dTDP-4-dehydrorhamnose reductase [Marinilabiliales bacterium]